MQIYFSVEEYLETVYGRRMTAKEVFFSQLAKQMRGSLSQFIIEQGSKTTRSVSLETSVLYVTH